MTSVYIFFKTTRPLTSVEKRQLDKALMGACGNEAAYDLLEQLQEEDVMELVELETEYSDEVIERVFKSAGYSIWRFGQ